MKTTSLFFVPLLMVFAFSFWAGQKAPTLIFEEENENSLIGGENEAENPDSMIMWNNRMIQDPSTGTVPVERLQTAIDNISNFQAFLSSGGAIGTPPGGGLPTYTPIIMNWIEMGPSNVGGRTRSFLIDKNDPTGNKLWAGGVSGGLWKSLNGGQTWINVGDAFENLAITSIAQHPTNPQIMYFATGEGQFIATSSPSNLLPGVKGAGIWRTTNGGNTWAKFTPNNLPYPNGFDYITEIAVKSDNDVLVGTCRNGLYWLDNGGIGGTNFTKVLGYPLTPLAAYGDHLFVSDIEIASDGQVYAVISSKDYQTASAPSSIFKSTDGVNWTITNLPTLPSSFPNTTEPISPGRIKISTGQPTQVGGSSVLYALIANNNTLSYNQVNGSCIYQKNGQRVLGLYRSTDAGTTWSSCNQNSYNACNLPNDITQYMAYDFTNLNSWYSLALSVCPTNPNLVYIGGLNLFKGIFSPTSETFSWQQVSAYGPTTPTKPYVHTDQHIIVFNPANANTIYFGNDGGLFKTTNGLSSSPTFTAINQNYNVTQLYSVEAHPTSWTLLAGSQDNGTRKYTGSAFQATTIPPGSTTVNCGGTPTVYTNQLAGDGGYCFIDQTTGQSNYQFASYLNNRWFRSNDNGISFQELPMNSYSSTGLFINPADYDDQNNILYTASTGATLLRWSNMASTATPAQYLITLNSNTAYQTSHVKVSPNNTTNPNVYVGTVAPNNSTKAKVYKVINAKTTPTIVDISTSANFPLGGNISCVEVQLADENHIVVSFYNYGISSVWETKNGGTTWNNLDLNNTLDDIPIRWVIFAPSAPSQAAPVNPYSLLLATEAGVWSTTNINGANTSWGPSLNGLSKVRVDMLKWRTNDNLVFAATHGRGLFRTDAFSPIQMNFTASTTTPCSDGFVDFTDLCTGATSWAWDFNSDGTIDATTQNPQDICNPGPNVTLTINGNISYTKVNYININTSCSSFDCNAIGGGTRISQNVSNNAKVYPNPMNEEATISFNLENENSVSIKLYSTSGLLVQNIQNSKPYKAGSHQVNFESGNLPKGVYLLQILIGDKNESHKIIIE